MKKLISKILISSISVLGLMVPALPSQAVGPVTVEAANGSLTASNTSRKIAVAPNGDIFVLYHLSNAITVAKSTDNGATFSSGVTVEATSRDAELSISTSGTLYVTWTTGTEVKQKRSTDAGATWSSAVTVASSTQSNVHTAVDREYVYVIPKNGSVVWSSADSGDVWRETSLSSTNWIFSDIVVDPLTGRAHPFVDRPQVSWFYSDDRGLSFSSEQPTSKSVTFSTAAISSTPTTKYLFMAGSGTNLERLNLLTNDVTSTVIEATGNSVNSSTSRSLAADAYGNVVSAGLIGSDFAMQVSNDFGATFSASSAIEATTNYGSISINQINGDVLALWQNGGAIKFQVFSGLLTGYDLNLDVTALEFDSAGTKDVILTNTSSSSITVSNIELSNSDFTQTNTCTSALAASASCTITVTATNAGSAIMTITASGGIVRYVPIAYGASSLTVTAPAVTSDGGAAFVPYTGPVVDASKKEVAAGSTIKLSGSNLSGLTKATINGIDAKLKVNSATEIEITIPAGLAGLWDLVITSSEGLLTVQDALNITSSNLLNSGAGTKLLSDGTFRVYFFDPAQKGKVQFFVNGKEVAWVNAVDNSDSKLLTKVINGQAVPYLVRTLKLVPGKNAIEVFVAGKRVKRVAYTG